MTDLTARLNTLASKVPEVRPVNDDGEVLRYAPGIDKWYWDDAAGTIVKAPNALWLASILTWLAERESKTVEGLSFVTLSRFPTRDDYEVSLEDEHGHRSKSGWLEAALSAAERVAGIQQQEQTQ